jgi:hypothetical protein
MRVSKRKIQEWTNELRSGKYNQTRYKLEDENGLCCLGVACKVFIKEDKLETKQVSGHLFGATPKAQKHAPHWLKIINADFARLTKHEDERCGVLLEKLNDIEMLNFDEIADCLEAVYIYEVMS